jgi:tetratricopeptide (TPR) repeat protein
MISGTALVLILVTVAVAAVVFIFIRRANRMAAVAKASTASQSASTSTLRSAITTGDESHTANGAAAPVADRPTAVGAPAQKAVEPEAEQEAESEPTAAQLIAEGDQYMHAFAYDEAIDSYEGAVDAVTAEHGRESLAFADLLVKTEDAYSARDNEDDTDDLNCTNYLRALSVMERCVGAFDARLLPVINRIVSFYLLVGKVSEAESLVRRQQLIELRVKQAQPQETVGAVQPAASVAVTEPVAGVTAHIALVPVAVQPLPTAQSELAPAPAVVPNVVDANKGLRSAIETGNSEVDHKAAEGDTARVEFDYDTAADHYNEALDAAREAYGRNAIQLVPLLVRMGEVCHVRDILDSDSDGDTYTDPIDRTSLALSLLVREGGIKDVRLVPVLTNMVAFSDQIGDHFKADRYMSMIDSITEASRRSSAR